MRNLKLPIEISSRQMSNLPKRNSGWVASRMQHQIIYTHISMTNGRRQRDTEIWPCTLPIQYKECSIRFIQMISATGLLLAKIMQIFGSCVRHCVFSMHLRSYQMHLEKLSEETQPAHTLTHAIASVGFSVLESVCIQPPDEHTPYHSTQIR